MTLRNNQVIQIIRQLDLKDLELVWRTHERKAKNHYKSKLSSFRVVQLSKLDPEVKKLIADQGKPDSTAMNDVLNDPGELVKTSNRKKKPGSEGPTLDERK
jgi:hypothetical protein